jgi:hypothetical protein
MANLGALLGRLDPKTTDFSWDYEADIDSGNLARTL